MVSPDDIILWPDSSWCFRHELAEYGWKSDDYVVIEQDTPAYDQLTEGD